MKKTIKQRWNHLNRGGVTGYEAKLTFRVIGNARSKKDFEQRFADDNILVLVKQLLERNNLAVADRDGLEPKLEIL